MHEYTERTLPCKTVQTCYGGSVLLFRNGFCLFAGAVCRGLLLRVLNETHRTSNMASICYIVADLLDTVVGISRILPFPARLSRYTSGDEFTLEVPIGITV